MDSSRPRILIIYTGGTIGMIQDPSTHTLEPFDFNHLIDNVPKVKMLDYNIEHIQFNPPIDSSNMNPAHWQQIATEIERHVFPYSIRKGTKAAEMPKQIDGTEKERRSKILIELSNKNQLEYNKKYIGQTVEVLIEEDSKGHTANYIVVKVNGAENLENEIINVKITKAKGEILEGNLE